jgi:hypothetical protein
LISSVSFARPGHPHPGPGPGPGFNDPCTGNYNGSYQRSGPMAIALNRGWGNQVQATIWYRGVGYYAQGYCNDNGFSVTMQNGYVHQGSFTYGPWGVNGVQGQQIVGGMVSDTFWANR